MTLNPHRARPPQAHELAILEFEQDEKVIQHNEQATFFGVILEGSLSPVRAPLGPQTRAQLSPLSRAPVPRRSW